MVHLSMYFHTHRILFSIFSLVLLVLFNALLFYKLWSLENLTNVLYFPHSQETIDRIMKYVLSDL